MAEDRRINFRSYYYDKVGFRVVEEKKSLEILLKEDPLDTMKLVQFCQRFSVPSMYRGLVWKVLLGVLPPHKGSHNFVSLQRREQYEDLERALEIMKKVDKETARPVFFLKMYLLEEGKLLINEESQLTETPNLNFIAIATTCTCMFEDDVESFWITKNLHKLQMKFQNSLPGLVDSTETFLQKEDPALYSHLASIQALRALPIRKWYEQCFAGVLHETPLQRIWDKIIGTCMKILVCVSVSLLVALRRSLMTCTGQLEVMGHFCKISEETSEIISNQAIELWQKHSGQLVEAGKTIKI